MSSKRGLAGKRAALPRRSDHTKEFLKTGAAFNMLGSTSRHSRRRWSC